LQVLPGTGESVARALPRALRKQICVLHTNMHPPGTDAPFTGSVCYFAGVLKGEARPFPTSGSNSLLSQTKTDNSTISELSVPSYLLSSDCRWILSTSSLPENVIRKVPPYRKKKNASE